MPYHRHRKYCQDPGFQIALGRRLKSERTRLRMKPPEAAAIALVSKATFRNYERAITVPDSLALDRLYQNGFDIGYVVTGVRHIRSAAKADQLILELFRALGSAAKKDFLDLAFDLFKREVLGGNIEENQDLAERVMFGGRD